jgi:hypothetical protein
MLQNLNLTAEEEQILAFSDDEEDDGAAVEWALVGKILSPAKMHLSTIHQVVLAPWGNPHGLKIRAIGEKGVICLWQNLRSSKTVALDIWETCPNFAGL